MSEPLTRRGRNKPSTEDKAELESRIRASEEWISKAGVVSTYPWESGNPKVKVGYNVHLDEVSYLKLKWIAELEPKGSIRKLLSEGVEMVIEKKLKQYVKE